MGRSLLRHVLVKEKHGYHSVSILFLDKKNIVHVNDDADRNLCLGTNSLLAYGVFFSCYLLHVFLAISKACHDILGALQRNC